MNHRPSSPAARISSSGGGSFFSMVSLTRLQYGLSSTVKPWLPHQTTSPLLMTKLARPALTSLTISRATQSPPCSRNIVRCTPGRSLTSSTDASVTQPLSTVSVITSVLVMNGITTWISSFVSGSKIIFTSLFTTSSATRSGMTRPNISTKSFTRSGSPAFSGRYIIGRVSPTAAKEKPLLVGCGAAAEQEAPAGVIRSGRRHDGLHLDCVNEACGEFSKRATLSGRPQMLHFKFFLRLFARTRRLLDLRLDAPEVVGLRGLQRRELPVGLELLQPKQLADRQDIPIVDIGGQRAGQGALHVRQGLCVSQQDSLLEGVALDVRDDGPVEVDERIGPAGRSGLSHAVVHLPVLVAHRGRRRTGIIEEVVTRRMVR